MGCGRHRALFPRVAGSIIITRRVHHPLVKCRTYEPYDQVAHMQYGSGSLGDSMRILYRIKTCDVKLRDLIGVRLAFGNMFHDLESFFGNMAGENQVV